jgi:hypothetical protein
MFRKRSVATEKLLIDECIEESRRILMHLGRLDSFSKTGEYEFDTTGLPKDTGQDVKTYMEEIYDPEVSKMYLMATQDVTPANEAEHTGKFRPSKEEREAKIAQMQCTTVRDDLHGMRPPPPPDNL